MVCTGRIGRIEKEKKKVQNNEVRMGRVGGLINQILRIVWLLDFIYLFTFVPLRTDIF